MEAWGVFGFFIFPFVPMLARLHWLAGVAGIGIALLIMMLTGNSGIGSLGVAALVLGASSFVVIKKTGEIQIVDIFSLIASIVLIVLALVLA